MPYFMTGVGVYFILCLIIGFVALMITIAPLLIWRNGNRANRLLALIALQQGVSEVKIKEALNGAEPQLFKQRTSQINSNNYQNNANNSSRLQNKDEDNSAESEDSIKQVNLDLINRYSSQLKEFFPYHEWVTPTPFKSYALLKDKDEFKIIKIGGLRVISIPKNKLDQMPQLKEWMESFLSASSA